MTLIVTSNIYIRDAAPVEKRKLVAPFNNTEDYSGAEQPTDWY
jgi:hypothetical protein